MLMTKTIMHPVKSDDFSKGIEHSQNCLKLLKAKTRTYARPEKMVF